MACAMDCRRAFHLRRTTYLCPLDSIISNRGLLTKRRNSSVKILTCQIRVKGYWNITSINPKKNFILTPLQWFIWRQLSRYSFVLCFRVKHSSTQQTLSVLYFPFRELTLYRDTRFALECSRVHHFILALLDITPVGKFSAQLIKSDDVACAWLISTWCASHISPSS